MAAQILKQVSQNPTERYITEMDHSKYYTITAGSADLFTHDLTKM